MSTQEPQDTSLLRELADEATGLVSTLANATESARDLRDRASSASVLGLRDGFDDAAMLRHFYQEVVRLMIRAACRAVTVDDLLKRLPADDG